MTLFIAEDLYPEKLEGDEPEPLDIVRWPLAQAEELLTHLDFCGSQYYRPTIDLRSLNNN